MRSLAGAIRGDGNFSLGGTRYPFRVSSGDGPDGKGTRVHLNIDPGTRPLIADLEGVLTLPDPRAALRWRGDHFRVEQSEAGYRHAVADRGQGQGRSGRRVVRANRDQLWRRRPGAEMVGVGDAKFGAAPLLHAVLSARQLDADRFVAGDAGKKDSDKTAEPMRLLPGLRALIAALPQLPIPAKIEFSSEQIMLGGRPLQNLTAELDADANTWSIDRLDFRAPGSTQVSLGSSRAQAGPAAGIKGALDVNSSDPDTLVAWLQGRSDMTYRSQKPLRLQGDVDIAADRVAIDGLKADIDGGAVTGRIAFASAAAGGGSRFDADLKADRLDLDAATALLRALAGPQAEWPDEATGFAGYRPRDIGRPGSASADGQTRLRSEADLARSIEDRRGRQRLARRQRAISTAPTPPASWH